MSGPELRRDPAIAQTFSIPWTLRERLIDLAKREGNSLSSIVRGLLEGALEKLEEKEASDR